jgi:FKBP-type peptidyl-prolyl cis-trans isomerase SlyD
MKISDEKMVSLSYNLSVDEGEQKEIMETATREQPLTFMFGMGMMLESFEKNIAGLEMGDKFSFTLSPEEAYGEYFENRVAELPKKMFTIDKKFDTERVFEGASLPMQDANGNRFMGSVLDIQEDIVVMDFNHPLAGETLHFEGEVIDIHEATPQEIAAMTRDYDCNTCDGTSEGKGCHCGS